MNDVTVMTQATSYFFQATLIHMLTKWSNMSLAPSERLKYNIIVCQITAHINFYFSLSPLIQESIRPYVHRGLNEFCFGIFCQTL